MSSVAVSKAPCGCESVLFHLPSCRLVHGAAAKPTKADLLDVSDRTHCDAEDGSVWIHVGDSVALLTPKAARNFGDQLHVCAQAAEKQT